MIRFWIPNTNSQLVNQSTNPFLRELDLPELGVGVAGHPHRELARIEVVHELVALHVLLPRHKGEPLDVVLVRSNVKNERTKRSDIVLETKPKCFGIVPEFVLLRTDCVSI